RRAVPLRRRVPDDPRIRRFQAPVVRLHRQGGDGVTRKVRDAAIRIKLQEMTESVDMVKENLPDSANSFRKLGIVKDGIYKRAEYAIESVFDICAILNTDLHLGVPGTDENILDNLVQHGVLVPETRQNLKAMKGFRNIVVHRYGAI